MFNSRLFTLLCAFALLAFVGCADTEAPEADMADDATETMDDTMDDMDGNTIVDVAEDAGLTTLRTAIAQANLDETLSGEGPFTVFAPSDEAFNALPEGTLESLLQEENRDQLANILTYHVIPSSVMSGDLSGEMTVTTVQGQPLTVNASEGTVTVTDAQGNTATVISADNEASNGVIHVIDGVLMPAEGEDTMEGEDAM
jgi:uncharacterized surface protein with fasciclin (FAS1) repeats